MGMSLEKMKNIDVRTVNPETLVDVTKIVIDESLSKEERVAEYLRQVRNPYCFRVDDLGVKLEFLDSAPSLQDVLSDFFQRKKSGL